MDKVAYYKGEEIAREKAIDPYRYGRFNIVELNKFYHKIGRTINYNNSKEIEFYCQYQEV